MHNVRAVMIGLITTFVFITMLQTMSGVFWPIPTGLDMNDKRAVEVAQAAAPMAATGRLVNWYSVCNISGHRGLPMRVVRSTSALRLPLTRALPADQPDWLVRVQALAQQLARSPDLFPDADASPGPCPHTDAAEICPDCTCPPPDPDPARLHIDLHAFKYASPAIGTFASPCLPAWCPALAPHVLDAAQAALSALRE